MSESKIHNFEYDDFQREAIEAVKRGNHVMVSAPTGAGKTVIAEYLCHQAVNRGEGIIYTAPVKALSNQKYRDFSYITFYKINARKILYSKSSIENFIRENKQSLE